MSAEVFDPFHDYDSVGYLRNKLQTGNIELLRSFELAAFSEFVGPALQFLKRQRTLEYQHVLLIHRMFFQAAYPWAGEDRMIHAPDIAIGKAGISTMFAHPRAIRQAMDYALAHGQNAGYLRAHPGEVYAYLAHAHPFLDGNGRTIATVHNELCRRAGFHVLWHKIGTEEFLKALTDDLLRPDGGKMDKLVSSYVVKGPLAIASSARHLKSTFIRVQS